MSAPPPTASANEILGMIGNAVNVQTPPPAPPTVTPQIVQGGGGGNGINVAFTERERALAAINLSYFVGAVMTLVIVLVFIDYLAHMPATPLNAAMNQPAQQASPTPTTNTPQPSPTVQRTAEAQQTTLMREAAFLQAPAAQATPSPQPTGDASPSTTKTASPTPSPTAQAAAPKTETENFV